MKTNHSHTNIIKPDNYPKCKLTTIGQFSTLCLAAGSLPRRLHLVTLTWITDDGDGDDYDDDGDDDDYDGDGDDYDGGDDEMGHLRVPGSGRNDKPATRFRTRLSAENISSKKFSEEKNVKKILEIPKPTDNQGF